MPSLSRGSIFAVLLLSGATVLSTLPAAAQPTEPLRGPAAEQTAPTAPATPPAPVAADAAPSPADIAPAPEAPLTLGEAGHLLVLDARTMLGAPLRWDGRDWGRFGLVALGVGGVALADRGIRDRELRDHSKTANDVARIAEPFGAQDSLVVLGGFYLGGLLSGDTRARDTGFDGAVASLTSAVITSVVKEVVGRKRPNQAIGAFDFRPFGGSASFPSGHTTQAFAVASAIATSYDSRWVAVGSYGVATLVGLARVHHQAHFASDVVAGAAIGTAVGRTVVLTNRWERQKHARVTIGPALGPRNQPGLALAASF
jgi:hypothetical protein